MPNRNSRELNRVNPAFKLVPAAMQLSGKFLPLAATRTGRGSPEGKPAKQVKYLHTSSVVLPAEPLLGLPVRMCKGTDL